MHIYICKDGALFKKRTCCLEHAIIGEKYPSAKFYEYGLQTSINAHRIYVYIYIYIYIYKHMNI